MISMFKDVDILEKMDAIYDLDLMDELLGDWSGERCPKCRSELLSNRYGDKWCSMVGCEHEELNGDG